MEMVPVLVLVLAVGTEAALAILLEQVAHLQFGVGSRERDGGRGLVLAGAGAVAGSATRCRLAERRQTRGSHGKNTHPH